MSAISSELPSTNGDNRRGSIAKVFGKVKTVMKRRLSSGKVLQSPQAQPNLIQEASHVNTRADESTTSRHDSPVVVAREPHTTAEATATATLNEPTEILLIAAEDGTENDDRDETVFPFFPSRNGIREEKARDLFAKYGFDYKPRDRPSSSEPPVKLRRVEKAVRLRIHWSCHECRRQFAIERTCTACGHRRCQQCTRLPQKKMRQLMQVAREQVDQAEQEPSAASSQEQPPVSIEAVAVEPITPPSTEEPLSSVAQQLSTPNESAPNELPRTSAPAVLGDPLSQPLERDENLDETDFSLTEIQYSIYQRPRTCVRPVMKARAIPMNWTTGTQLNKEMPMVRAVQRVYRKPRQRVRYTCERCETLFVVGDQCAGCGHGRCNECHREPPKRSPPEHDPEALRSVANRLAGYGGVQPQVIAPASS